jgi:hypothetical protein
MKSLIEDAQGASHSVSSYAAKGGSRATTGERRAGRREEIARQQENGSLTTQIVGAKALKELFHRINLRAEKGDARYISERK